ncbi:putative sterol 14-alpha-demethylase transcription factor MYB-HB-like family [Medicago truncatula]|uniref:Myb-like transcription factor family protein n=1 Tax=Medicago truncatula TaxID=3880 RepID=G7JF47_MEDTR|nr:myb family transcription factor PHL8 [Medicago truncatula]AES89913.2 myb-like transcription factor family protein [Medicago truncatula]RHN61977.1 putative sterol 14-alpha-demethylase transcription factor MYB-HB-like family [Medicago truncatula]
MDQQNQSMRLVLSTDAKPRLKWTHELHQRFTDAINQLGGAEKATPKSLMRVMGIPGLTLYHLKSHLQKYRLGKSQLVETCSDNKQDYIEIQNSDGQCSREISVGNQNQTTESLKIAEALEVQMEVQKKLYEQIEVQKHLQFRIEAQGKYLQSVLMKAQEALAGYSSSSSTTGVEHAKAELSQLLSIINNACPSSPLSELTETRGFSLNFGERKQNRGTMCSLESSLTSSESSERKEEKQTINEAENTPNYNSISVELPLMAIESEGRTFRTNANDGGSGRKRSATIDLDGRCVDQPDGKICGKKPRKSEFSQMLDLNSKYERDIDSSSLEIDLNCSSSF